MSIPRVQNGLSFFLALLFLAGCSTTLHERKPSEKDPGAKTELKLTGPQLKVQGEF